MSESKYRIVEDKGHKDRIKRTADVVSQARYLEGEKDAPLFTDPFARLFITPEAEQMLAKGLKRWPFFAEYLIVRERFFDDKLSEFYRKENPGQLVILGAGNDMRAERLPFLKNKKVFEVDLPEEVAAKKEILAEVLGKLPGHVVYAGADVAKPGFMSDLKQQGFDPNVKTAYVLQGLIYYMKPEGVDSLFKELMKVFSPGDLLLLDQVSGDMSQTPPHPSDPAGYLSSMGFSITERALLGNLTAHYFGKAYKDKWWVITAGKKGD
jgi:methyltransferase (TIGR00027 family)